MSSMDLNRGMAWRLKRLREENNLSHESLSDALAARGVKVGKDSLIKYEQSTAPTMKSATLLGLAELYGVTTDYLLCRTDVPTPDETVRAVCDVIGVSEKAAENMGGRRDWFYRVGTTEAPLDNRSGLKPSELLSHLLENDRFWQVLGNLSICSENTAQDYFSLADQFNPLQSGLPAVPDYLEPNPAYNPISLQTRDLFLAAAVVAFGEAAKEVLSNYEAERRY